MSMREDQERDLSPLEILYEAVNNLEDPYEDDSKDGKNGVAVAKRLMLLEPVLQALSTPEGGGVPEGWKIVPVDNVERPHSDSVLPFPMIEAGMAVIDKIDEDLLNYDPGETDDWDSGMIAVAVYRAMLAAAPAAPVSAPSVGVKIKELEWHEKHGCHYAEPSIGDYMCERDEDEDMASSPWVCGAPDGVLGHFTTLAEAKAAAQADYERRILSALSPSPKGVDAVEVARAIEVAAVDALPDAAVEAIGQMPIEDIIRVYLKMARAALKAAGIPDTSEGGE